MTTTEREDLKLHGVYALTNDPDYLVFDADLMDRRAAPIGNWEDYHLVGSLPLGLEFDPEFRHYRVVAIDDHWETEYFNAMPYGQDCACEIAARAAAAPRATD